MSKLSKTMCFLGIVAGAVCITHSYCEKKNQKKITQITKEKDKFYQMFRLSDDWVNAKIKKSKMEDYLLEKNYKSVAIYGMSYVGQSLINELEDSKICIKYGIDRDAEVYWDAFPIVKPEEVYEEVDAIIVTSIFFFDEIKHTLEKKVNCPIISLQSIIDVL